MKNRSFFEVIPAIDILGGQVVRLVRGDYKKKTVFSDDPVAMAKHWAKLGAPRLHVVDLDGAKAGRSVNLAVIKKIVKAVRIPVQTGGGFRKMADIEKAIRSGVDRVILGTAAAQDLTLVARACRRWPGRIAVGIDVKDGKIAVRGWLTKTSLTPDRFAARLWRSGVRVFVYTNISRDGTLSGPDIAGAKKLAVLLKGLKDKKKISGKKKAAAAAKSKPPARSILIASGGIGCPQDIKALARLKNQGIEGAIIGKALYTGQLPLKVLKG